MTHKIKMTPVRLSPDIYNAVNEIAGTERRSLTVMTDILLAHAIKTYKGTPIENRLPLKKSDADASFCEEHQVDKAVCHLMKHDRGA